MSTPLKSFCWIFVMITTFGLLVGTLNLWNPDLVHIPFGVDVNGEPQSAEGMDGVITAVLSAAVYGVIFGCIASLFAWFSNRIVERAKDI